MEARSGIVWIAQRLEGWPGDAEFYGHWDTGEIVDGPGWDTAEEAIAWGRVRAPVVVIRVGRQPWQQHYSAGDVFPEFGDNQPRGGVLPWPSGPGDDRGAAEVHLG